MNLTIHHPGLSVPPSLSARIEQHLRFALRRFAHRVASATVRIRDLNGPRGGIDKELRVRLDLSGARAVQVVERCADLLAGASAAARRVSRVVARAIARARGPGRR